MDQLQKLREAIEEGASREEIARLLSEVNWDEIPEDDQSVFFQEVRDNPVFTQAVISSAIETGEIKAGTAPIIGPAGIAGPGTFGAMGGSLTPGARAVASEISEEAVRATVKDPTLAKNVLSFLARHKKGLAATVGLGGLMAFGTSGVPEIQAAGETGSPGGPPTGPGVTGPVPLEDPERTLTAGRQGRVGMLPGKPRPPTNDPRVQQADYGYNILVVDRDGSLTGVPGQVAVIPPDALGPGGGNVSPGLLNDIAQSVTFNAQANVGGQVATGSDLVSASLASGSFGLQLDNRIQQVIQPRSMTNITIAAPVQTGRSSADIVASVDPESRAEAARASRFRSRVTAPAGASIASRVFQETRGRTLLEWAGIAAQRHGVPLNVLYGIIDHESNWNPNAVGDNGKSFGLAQIFMDVWGGQVTPGQARDPVFALNWAAQNLARNYKRYGRWDAAIAAHNHPVAADHLARTGRFLTEKSANYVGSVMGRANQSGLDNTIFAEDELMGIEIEGSGGSGPQYSPFQSPDPAASREFVRETYKDMLGREPTEEEMELGVNRIAKLARQQYGANLTQAKGGKSQAVDVEAQFREGLRDTGEFAFSEDTHQLDSFTEYAAGVARLLQQGL